MPLASISVCAIGAAVRFAAWPVVQAELSAAFLIQAIFLLKHCSVSLVLRLSYSVEGTHDDTAVGTVLIQALTKPISRHTDDGGEEGND